MNTLDSWQTLQEVAEKHPQFNPGTLRYLMIHRKQKGIEHLFMQVGKKFLIHTDRFSQWLEAGGAQK